MYTKSTIDFKNININLKDAYRYIKDNSVFLTHEEFVNLCGSNDYKGNLQLTGEIHLLITDNDVNYFIEGKDGCNYILDTEGIGSIVVTGSNNCNVIRDGSGTGDAIRVGDGSGNATRIYHKPKMEPKYRTDRFIGSSIRDGYGYGSAMFLSFYAGNALRIGSGKGGSYKFENSSGGVCFNQSNNDIDILTIPKRLIKDEEDLLAKVIDYSYFISTAVYEGETYWIEANNENIIVVVGENDSPCSVGMRGDLNGSIELRLNMYISNSVIVSRVGVGYGHSIISGKGHGNVIRAGEGEGHSISMGEIMGTARKIGKGSGEVFKDNPNLGGVVRTI